MAAIVAAGWSSVAGAGSARDPGPDPLAAAQQRYSRVREARARQGAAVDRLFAAAGVAYPAPLLVRAFKEEAELELWARPEGGGRYVRVAVFPFTAISGFLGPKRARGDRQIPEGFYRIDGFNGASRYHLSLHIDYPNASDLVLGHKRHPGNNIFIHGNEMTNGCIPLGDRAIERLYLAVLDSRATGHEVPVQIFPCRFGSEHCERIVRDAARRHRRLAEFWANLREGDEIFRSEGAPPRVGVATDGRYLFSRPASGEADRPAVP